MYFDQKTFFFLQFYDFSETLVEIFCVYVIKLKVLPRTPSYEKLQISHSLLVS